MRADLSMRDGFGFKAWQLGLLALVLALVFGGMHSGASWGASAYDPASDPYSMQNITAGDGAQAWWNAGYTGKGVGRRDHRHGRLARSGARTRPAS